MQWLFQCLRAWPSTLSLKQETEKKPNNSDPSQQVLQRAGNSVIQFQLKMQLKKSPKISMQTTSI